MNQYATFPVEHITLSINCPADKVYDYASNGANLPQWASGLSKGVESFGHDWIADSPMGKVRVRFVEKNKLGVMDHFVTLPTGETFANPFRVIPNKSGCELVFTLFRHEGMSDSAFDADRSTIKKDLQTLKFIIEGQQNSHQAHSSTF